jgi:hypothetical protein
MGVWDRNGVKGTVPEEEYKGWKTIKNAAKAALFLKSLLQVREG